MNFADYQALFTQILDGKITSKPYDDPHYLEYVKLNSSRQNRWIKTGDLDEETRSTVQSISKTQHWILITEPWCGDASHIVPFIIKMTELNPLIDLSIQLRDSEGSEIDKYLTNGGKSIPMLIVRDENHQDLFYWGPRPHQCQELYLKMKAENAPFDEVKVTLQQWYNENKGKDIQKELSQKLIEASV
jgi:hypothetical protein